MFKRASRLAAIAMAIAAAGCSGSDGSQGPQGPQGIQGVQGPTGNTGTDLTATAQPESCTVCHKTSGSQHQSLYTQYTDASTLAATIDSVATVGSITTVKLSVTLGGAAAKLASLAQKTVYGSYFDGTSKFPSNLAFNSVKADPAFPGVDGKFLSTAAVVTPVESGNGFVYAFFAANALPTEGMTIYSDVANVAQAYGNVGTYASAANVAGCERCHGTPYMKHGYRAAKVAGLSDFAACKACHYDTRNGSDQDWTRLVDDPLSFSVALISTTQQAMYAYKASVMNDVHMSHAMEFAYPQSMANCRVCHEGKTAQIFAAANLNITTCRSCHPVSGPANTGDADKARAPALKTLMTAKTALNPNGITAHNGFLDKLYANSPTAPTACTNCHDGSGAPTFAEMHNNGFIKAIADSAGNKTASIFTVTVDSAVQTANTVRVSFSATKGAAAAELDPTTVGSIVPTILVGIYGYDTKDFIVDPHGRVNNVRNLEFVWGGTHARFKNPSYSNGTWSIDVSLGDFATQLATSGRFEVGIIPTVKAPDGTILAVNAPSKTFIAGSGALSFKEAEPIADAAKCNKCHEALGSTFHSPDRGGNVLVCRFCHNTRSGGGHLEMQSRSIDSYVHSIHKFQVFDIASIDPANPVSAMRYTHHTESGYPNFTILNCESCHVAGKYEAPANDKSLPGVLSAAANITVRGSWNPGNSSTRNGPLVAPSLSPQASTIGPIPAMVTGPASRACGSCHRATKINENDAAALNAFNGHADAMGYMLTSGTTTLDDAITKIMSFFR